MHIRRLRKQIGYGLLYLVGWGVLIGGIALLIVRPSVPDIQVPEPTPQFDPIAVQSVSAVPHGDTVDLVAQVTNPNPRSGVPEYAVVFVVRDAAGVDIMRQPLVSYVLPGSTQYLIALNVPVPPGSVADVRLEMPPNPAFVSIPNTITLPNFTTLLGARTIIPRGVSSTEEQKGIVRNGSTFDFQRVEVAAIGLAASGDVVAVGKTFLGELTVGEQREFTVQWPVPAQPIERVVPLATTNIFREDNIIRAIGDPSLLR